MLEHLRRLQQEMESLGEAVDEKFGILRTEMRGGFTQQERTQVEQQRVLAEQQRLFAELQHQQAEQARISTELGRDIARQGASFDQTVAGMQEDFVRSRRNQATIWSGLIEHAAEMQNDVGDLKRDATDLRRRVGDLERRVAG